MITEMQTLKYLTNSLLRPTASSILLSSRFKMIEVNTITNLVRNLSVSSPCHLHLTPTLEQKKARKLPAHMYGGGENGGLDYGFEVMESHRKGPHRKIRVNKNPLGPGIPFAKGIVIKPVIKKPKKPNSANRKVILSHC